MRLLFLAPGSWFHTQKWLTYFAARDHEVHLISRDIEDPGIPNVRWHPLVFQDERLPTLRAISALIQVRFLIRRIKPEVLHAHFVSEYGALAAFSGFRPFLMTAWGSDILTLPNQATPMPWHVPWSLKRARLVTCDGDNLVTRLTGLGVAPENIRLICFGVDLTRFRRQSRDASLTENLRLPEDSQTVISLRSLRPHYDVETLVRAAPGISAGAPRATIIIVGDGPQRRYLEDLAGSLRVAPMVRFVGAVPNNRIPAYLAAADVYVSTSLSDGGLAISTAEAMACELPAVITDFGDNRNWVEEGRGGFLFPPKDVAKLTENVLYLLKNRDLGRAFGRHNRSVIEERNNQRREMEKMETIYREVAGERTS